MIRDLFYFEIQRHTLSNNKIKNGDDTSHKRKLTAAA